MGEKSSLNDILNVSKIISCNLYVNEGNFVIPSEAVQSLNSSARVGELETDSMMILRYFTLFFLTYQMDRNVCPSCCFYYISVQHPSSDTNETDECGSRKHS